MVREPAVAGTFYPAGAALAGEVDRLLVPPGAPPPLKERAIGLVAPHAGYVYSGAVAGAVYGRVDVPARVVVLGPNHTGLGRSRAALWPGGRWRTPLGEVAIDAELTAALATAPGVAADPIAHVHEHALEVQVPFLQRAHPGVTLTALCLAHLPYPACAALGEALAGAAREAGALLVASSDMSHHLPADEARARDARALERILALDPEGLHRVVIGEGISMCGVIPVTVVLVAARALGATRAELVRYAHSGEVNGDLGRVVGYAGVRIA